MHWMLCGNWTTKTDQWMCFIFIGGLCDSEAHRQIPRLYVYWVLCAAIMFLSSLAGDGWFLSCFHIISIGQRRTIANINNVFNWTVLQFSQPIAGIEIDLAAADASVKPLAIYLLIIVWLITFISRVLFPETPSRFWFLVILNRRLINSLLCS